MLSQLQLGWANWSEANLCWAELVKDLVREGNVLTLDSLSNFELSKNKKLKIINIGERLPANSREIMTRNKELYVTTFPQAVVFIGQSLKFIKDLTRPEVSEGGPQERQ